MDSLYKVFSRDVDVVYREDHIPTFNGFDSVHEALLECNPIYNDLSFADQMSLSAIIGNDLCPLAEEVPQPAKPKVQRNKHYIYTYEWYELQTDHVCILFDASTGNIVFQEWFKELQRHNIMQYIEDVEGLALFLIKSGELLEGDNIMFQSQEDTDSDDSDDSSEP